jgi:serpin B
VSTTRSCFWFFHAAWLQPFDPDDSKSGAFYSPSGQTGVTFMTESVATAALTSSYEAVQLPYTGGHYEALIIMPKTESLGAFVDGLSAHQVGQIIAASDEQAEIHVPRFTTRSYLDLNHTLEALGMPTAFTDGADFSGISPAPTYVQSAVQRDYLSVTEQGTEAAAATGIAFATAGSRVTKVITFDHPFFFAIRDRSTGVLLFASLVDNPSS